MWLAIAFWLASLGVASAQIVLTVDKTAQTFRWSGSATSDSYTIPWQSNVQFGLGTGVRFGGISPGGDFTVDVTSTFDSSSFIAANAGQLVIFLPDSVTTWLAQGFNFNSDEQDLVGTITVEGNGISVSYSPPNLPAPELTYLESLNGTPLYFLARTGNGDYSPFSPAGIILVDPPVVVPEPQTAAAIMSFALIVFAGLGRWRGGRPQRGAPIAETD